MIESLLGILLSLLQLTKERQVIHSPKPIISSVIIPYIMKDKVSLLTSTVVSPILL
jgi:hypothetical protein